MLKIKEFDFNNKDTIREISEYMKSREFNFPEKNKRDYFNNWPVVYIIKNSNKKNKMAYIGETTNIHDRITQHLKNPERCKLDKISIIFDDKFNKSINWDVESFLIKYMSSLYVLQNGNDGMFEHDYYGKDFTNNKLNKIWNLLLKNKIVDETIDKIENKNIFKYSPYKKLNDEQQMIISKIIDKLCTNLKGQIMISGVSGTGKTVIGIYILKLINHIKNSNINVNEIIDKYDSIDFMNIKKNEELKQLFNKKYKKIGFVVPLSTLRGGIVKIFKYDRDLDEQMVITPLNLNKKLKKRYDLLIVDETHRLKRPGFRADRPTQQAFNSSDFLDSTQLDWILNNSKTQIFLYDKKQKVRPSDIITKDIEELEKIAIYKNELIKQMRCIGGEKYIKSIDKFLHNKKSKLKIKGYDFKVFDSADEMINKIIELDKEYELCRNISGIYNSSNINRGDVIENIKNIPKNNKGKVTIDNKNYLWNAVNEDWIHTKNSVYQIGCLHTIQGCDLNYAGVILGDDIIYNPVTKKIEIDISKNNDKFAKVGKNNKKYDEDLIKDNIINTYYTLLTRGIRGTYVYASNKKLREYLMNLSK